MITKNLKPFLLPFACFCVLGAAAQVKTAGDAFIQKAANAAADRLSVQPTEKVYLHLDKSYYAAGDDIWFKAYVTTGELHKLSAISGVLTVELVGEKGGLMQTINVPLKYGLAAADFHLPNNTAAGTYQLRSYTNYMRNWGSEYFFSQPLNITAVTVEHGGNSKKALKTIQSAPAVAQSALAAVADVQFFPESGGLVNGLSSRVAFNATGPDGKGLALKGTVFDNAYNEVAQLASRHLGMGSFYLNPVVGRSYSAKLTFTDGSQTTVKLPAASMSGYVLSVSDNKESPELRCAIAYNGAATTDSTLVLIGQSAGQVCYIAKLKQQDKGVIVRIPKEKLPTGITQLTLFSEGGEPLAERLVFTNRHDQLYITLADSNKMNAIHKATTIKLHVKDGEDGIFRSFSAAVIDDRKAPDEGSIGAENILSYLLLTSDLKGKIEAPGYYFNSDTTAADLDLLMLTQGYRHFEWKKVLNGQLPLLTYLPQKGMGASGRLLSPSGKALANANVTLFDKQTGLLRDTVTGQQGEFAFNNLVFTDSIKVLLTGKTKNNLSDLLIKLDKPHSSVADMPMVAYAEQPDAMTVSPADTIPQVYQKLAIEKFDKYPTNGVKVLKEVNIKAGAPKNKVPEYSSNLNGPGNADAILLAKDMEGLGGSLCDVLGSGVLPGVTTASKQKQSGPGTSVKNVATSKHPKLPKANTSVMGANSTLVNTRNFNPMAIMLNGISYQGDPCSIDVAEVASVELLKSAGYTSVYGFYGGNGVIVITLKRGEIAESPLPGNVAMFTINGFYKARAFYSPKYDDVNVNTQLADLRSTIYWNPNIITDKEGNASFNYDNAGTKGTYRVMVQGIDINGKVGYQMLKYKVE